MAIEQTVKEFGRTLQDLAVKVAVFATRQGDIEKTQGDHEARLREIEKLAPALRAVLWVFSAVGVSVIGLIWAMITGQVTLVFQ